MQVLDRNKDGKIDKNDFFTGEKDKHLLVHVMQNNIEVAKPIKAKIWSQQVEWNRRIFPVDPKSFWVDAKGVNHQFVSANDVAVLRMGEKTDKCSKCLGRMTVDARNARELLKRNTIQAIWGIDSSHIILLMILGIGMMIAMGAVIFVMNENTVMRAKIESAIATGDTTLLLDKKPTTGTIVKK